MLGDNKAFSQTWVNDPSCPTFGDHLTIAAIAACRRRDASKQAGRDRQGHPAGPMPKTKGGKSHVAVHGGILNGCRFYRCPSEKQVARDIAPDLQREPCRKQGLIENRRQDQSPRWGNCAATGEAKRAPREGCCPSSPQRDQRGIQSGQMAGRLRCKHPFSGSEGFLNPEGPPRAVLIVGCEPVPILVITRIHWLTCEIIALDIEFQTVVELIAQ